MDWNAHEEPRRSNDWSNPWARAGCALSGVFFVVALVFAASVVFSDCGGTNTPALGDEVTVSLDTSGDVPAARTRAALASMAKSVASNDRTGFSLTFATDGVFVGHCATARLIDLAIGGERQVRIERDATYPSNNGTAVWVDASWLHNDCP